LIEGKIQFIELRKDERWTPVASLLLRDEAGKSLTGLQLVLESAKATNMQLALFSSDESEQRKVFAAGPWKNNQIEFTLVVSKSGNVKITVGSTSSALSIGASKVTTIELSCSSAEAKFSDISIIALE